MPLAPRSGYRTGGGPVGGAGTPVTNHEANVVAYVPGSGFIAAHDSHKVMMISQDGNLWGAVGTDRVLGELPMYTAGTTVWGLDTQLPPAQMIVTSSSSTWPQFIQEQLGVITATDSVNCWASSGSEILLLEERGRVTMIPRASGYATTSGVPSVPVNVFAVAGNVSATVTWSAPLNAGSSAITGYAVEAILESSGAVAASTSVLGSVRSATLANLSNGRTYSVRVAATNTQGTGPYSEWVPVVPSPQPPDAPRNLVATPAALVNGFYTQWTFTWDPPASTNGSAITGYVIMSAYEGSSLFPPGAVVARTGAQTSFTTSLFTGRGTPLLNRTRLTSYVVAAVSSAGQGPPSEPSAPKRLNEI